MNCGPTSSSVPERDFPGKNNGVGCHFLGRGDLPDPGIKPASLASPAMVCEFFSTASPGESNQVIRGLELSVPTPLTFREEEGLEVEWTATNGH